jgi:hypothetical protein
MDSRIRKPALSMMLLLGMCLLLSSCGGYSPQHYFKSFLNDPIPKSVTNLKGNYSGFPQGCIILTFAISQDDFLSMDALKKIPEVDRNTMDNLLFRKFDNLNEYKKYYMLLKEGESGKKHVQCLFWNPEIKKVYYYYE